MMMMMIRLTFVIVVQEGDVTTMAWKTELIETVTRANIRQSAYTYAHTTYILRIVHTCDQSDCLFGVLSMVSDYVCVCVCECVCLYVCVLCLFQSISFV